MMMVLVLIDIQMGFKFFIWGVCNNFEVEDNVVKLFEVWCVKGMDICYVCYVSVESGSFLGLEIGGIEFMLQVIFKDGELIFEKFVSLVFIGIEFEVYLCVQGVIDFVICGFMILYCVFIILCMGVNFGFSVIFVYDVCVVFEVNVNVNWFCEVFKLMF